MYVVLVEPLEPEPFALEVPALGLIARWFTAALLFSLGNHVTRRRYSSSPAR
jgi:hypothetical protein